MPTSTVATAAGQPPAAAREPRPCPFGPRGRVMTALLAEGLSFVEIGRRLQLSDSAAHRQSWALVKAAGCRNRIHLVAEAVRNGWIS